MADWRSGAADRLRIGFALYIDVFFSGSGSVSVDGSNSEWVNSGDLYIGNNDTGSLTITNGGHIVNATSYIGSYYGGSDSVMVNGASSAWTNTGDVYLGMNDNGKLRIGENGTASIGSDIGSLTIASYGSSTSLVNISSAGGNTAVPAGTLNAGVATYGSGTGSIVLNHTETAYDFAPDIVGIGSVDLYGGSTRFAGSLSGYTGTMTVDGGILYVVNGETLALGGDYLQTAACIFRIGASSSSSFGRLFVAGSATFAADTGIDVNVGSVNTLADGETLSRAINADSLSASTFTLNDNSYLFDFAVTINGNAVDLTITAAGTSSVIGPGTGSGTTTDTGTGTTSGSSTNTGTDSDTCTTSGVSSGSSGGTVLDSTVASGLSSDTVQPKCWTVLYPVGLPSPSLGISVFQESPSIPSQESFSCTKTVRSTTLFLNHLHI